MVSVQEKDSQKNIGWGDKQDGVKNNRAEEKYLAGTKATNYTTDSFKSHIVIICTDHTPAIILSKPTKNLVYLTLYFKNFISNMLYNFLYRYRHQLIYLKSCKLILIKVTGSVKLLRLILA
ncbi:hypothetical protein [Candidatus Odyssella acanthamoebae]|uniref:Uncharacterized protein n=1 Tax=Candidatus Odyssella acanthamoebae TaxID=91604 RepID=A0A077AVK7_9PROT|nr:hypothetical protein [Candidatus Paracaedibacter acanthamoebae]AIK95698.1 hypothetical protein ID47_01495 [Candidatus Paracaedibacter acanthamoebae]